MNDNALIGILQLLVYAGIAWVIWNFFFRESEEAKAARLAQEKAREDEHRRRHVERAAQAERDRKKQEAARKESARQQEQARQERARKKAEAQEEFERLVSQGMPSGVAKAHREYKTQNPLARGQGWYSEDVSPLTFYGYRVGKTRGLRASERREIIRYVLRARLADPLAKSYQTTWGPPFSRQRRLSIISHLDMLAAQRATRRNYEVAVAEWTEDSDWTEKVMEKEIAKLGNYGFG